MKLSGFYFHYGATFLKQDIFTTFVKCSWFLSFMYDICFVFFKFMTDGYLVQELMRDPLLLKYRLVEDQTFKSEITLVCEDS